MAYVNKENQGRYGVRENYIDNTVLVEYNLRFQNTHKPFTPFIIHGVFGNFEHLNTVYQFSRPTSIIKICHDSEIH